MKFVSSHNPPYELGEWKAREIIDAQRHYDGSLSTTLKKLILHSRVLDQGQICPYTQRAIVQLDPHPDVPDWDAHVEHLVPRSVSMASGNLDETVDYRNLLACVNKPADLQYGASAKGNITLSVHPFRSDCERRITYSLSGDVRPANESDSSARSAIEALRLDHTALVELRKGALAGFGLAVEKPKHRQRLQIQVRHSPASARRLAQDILRKRQDGTYVPFCVVIAHAALAYAELIEKRSARRRFSQRKDGE